MVQTVRIRKDKDKILLNFMYNTDLIDIMREHHGYFFRKEKAWVFPAQKQSELYNELTAKLYRVEIMNPQNQTTFNLKPRVERPKKEPTFNPWDDEGVFVVLGTCKACNQYVFVNKDKLCVRCNNG